MSVASSVACRLPEAPLIRLAEAAGMLWYVLDRRRAAQGRRNLQRVCDWLAAEGLGPQRARDAAHDPAALERLLRSAFRHQARYYLEVALAPSMTPRYVRERLTVETPDVVDHAFADREPVIVIGMHFGAIEFPALFLSERTGRHVTAPMETIDDAPLQAWFRRTRASVGINVVGLVEARRELLAALKRGDPAGLVADRDITGGGIATSLFGHPSPLPAGPALLALQAGVPAYAASVRRSSRGRYRGRLEEISIPAEGSRRERVTAFLVAEAAAFERFIAVAPEQWWAIFFPIWPDLEGPVAPGTSGRPGPSGDVKDR